MYTKDPFSNVFSPAINRIAVIQGFIKRRETDGMVAQGPNLEVVLIWHAGLAYEDFTPVAISRLDGVQCFLSGYLAAPCPGTCLKNNQSHSR